MNHKVYTGWRMQDVIVELCKFGCVLRRTEQRISKVTVGMLWDGLWTGPQIGDGPYLGQVPAKYGRHDGTGEQRSFGAVPACECTIQ